MLSFQPEIFVFLYRKQNTSDSGNSLCDNCSDVGFAFLNGLAEVVGRIGFAAILVNIPGVGMWAVWTTTCLTWVLTAVMCLIRYKGGKWRKKCLVDIEAAETEVIHAEQ